MIFPKRWSGPAAPGRTLKIRQGTAHRTANRSCSLRVCSFITKLILLCRMSSQYRSRALIAKMTAGPGLLVSEQLTRMRCSAEGTDVGFRILPMST
jgi:hypothetical protein